MEGKTMAVDPGMTRKVVVVHGVQSGPDNLNQDVLIGDLIKSRIGKIPISYACELYKYENLNAATLEKYKKLLDLMAVVPIGQTIGDALIEMVGDVVISLENGKTAQFIREGMRQKILDIYTAGNPCYIVAHSLGTIYAFDVLNSLIGDGEHFDPGSRKTWPIQGLLTLGSPIGLNMFKVTGRNSIRDFGLGDKWFRWLNIFDPNDPVVSGNIFGQHLSGYKIAENFLSGDPKQGWVIRDISADTGKSWLMAHTAYWHSPVVGDKLVDMITS
jgi:hypothetical protein